MCGQDCASKCVKLPGCLDRCCLEGLDMKWHWILIAALMTALVPGCGNGSSGVDVVSEDDEEEPETLLVDDSSADVDSLLLSESGGFRPPFPSNTSFFSPPEVEKAVALPDSASVAEIHHAHVRVIGFSQIKDRDPRALLSIGGHLQSVKEGDSVNGVTIVALDAPNVTLQQRTERWTVALFKQPIVNQQLSGLPQKRAVDRQSPRSSVARRSLEQGFGSLTDELAELTSPRGGSRSRSLTGSAINDLPPVPASLPEESLATIAELPDEFDLPKPPELPVGELSLEPHLPGIDELPTLPSF
tara:strand:- start:165537 stop:166439 length:903 start_codon:yes stop_codon:yes gene_type:complete